MVGIGGANQCKIILIRYRKEYPSVGILAEICLGGIEHLGHDDMRSAHQPDSFAATTLMASRTREQFEHGWTSGVRNGARLDAALPGDVDMPDTVFAFEMRDFGAGPDVGVMLRRIERIQYNKPRIVDPAIGIFKAACE